MADEDRTGAWRWNPLVGRWMLLAPRRAQRAHDHLQPAEPCPFCPGAEHLTPPEIARSGDPWQVRAFPNRYAALHPQPVPLAGEGLPTPPDDPESVAGPAADAPGFGYSEVVVLSPDHTRGFSQLGDSEAALAAHVLAQRLSDLSTRRHVRAALAFINHGRVAGASREHPHAQVMAIPVAPPEIAAEARSTAMPGCVLCGLIGAGSAEAPSVSRDGATGGIDRNRVPDRNGVLERNRVVAVCPGWAEWDDEVLLMPRWHSSTVDPDEGPDRRATVSDAGVAMRDVLHALLRLRGADTAYNVIWHVGPRAADFHWHLHLRPRRDAHAGFEQGTGLKINTVDPARTAAALRDLLP